MTTILEEPPIMCSLGGTEYQSRLAWIADLNAEALHTFRRDDLRLELIYKLDAVGRVRELMDREQDCCAFLDFDMREANDGVLLTITAPERARDAADGVFAQFLPKAPPTSAAGCGCRGGAAR